MTTDQKNCLLKAKIAAALHNELGWLVISGNGCMIRNN
jgi:hypothetical protein